MYIPSFFPDQANPTHGIFFKNQAIGLSQYVELSIMNIKTNWVTSFKRFGNSNFHLKRHSFECGFDLFQDQCLAIPKLQPLSSILYKKTAIELYEEIVKVKGRPDVIHAHITYPGGYIGMEISKKFNIPLVVTEHASYFSTKLQSGLYSKYTKEVLEHASIYTAVSVNLAEKVKLAGKSNCRVIPNFIEVDNFRLNKDKNNEIFSFVNLAAMRHIKGIDILLEAIKILAFDLEERQFHVNLIGGGFEEEKYKKMAIDLGISNWCSFHGNVEHDNIPDLLKDSHALVIASRFETFGIAGIEAMASGLPVLSTNCGGTKDYITNNTGMILKENSAKDLADGMLFFMKNKKKWNVEKIQKHVEDNYSTEAVCQEILKVYNQLTNK